MTPPAIPPDEQKRLAQLLAYGVMDTGPEVAFDDLTKLAAHVCESPIALVSFIDESRQWFKARCGLDAAETPRAISFCGHAILGDDVMVVGDALADERFADNPLVMDEPRIRFYAGAPLVTSGGARLGTLCVIDRVPRELSVAQLDALRALARQVVSQLELNLSLRERTQSEAALQIALSFENALLKAAGYSIISTDQEGVIRTFNQAAERQLGYPAEEVVGRETPAIFHDAEEVQRRSAELSAELGTAVEPGFEVFVARSRAGATDEREWTYVRKDGSRYPVMLCVTAIRQQNQITGFLGIARDITDQKRTLEALRESENAMAAVLYSALDCIITMDEDGRIAEFNPAAERTFGYLRDAVIGKQLADMIIPPHLREQHRKGMAHYLSTGVGPVIGQRVEVTGMRSDQSEFPVELAITVVRHRGRSTFTAYLRDITERRRHEKALQEAKEASDMANAELARANRLKDEFLANMSHELRTPLNSILGMSEALMHQAYGGLNDKQCGCLKVVHESGRHLLDLINDVLDLSKIEAGRLDWQMDSVSSKVMCEVAHRIMKEPASRKRIALSLAAPDDLPSIHADARRIKQILVNLLSNAVKFTPESGSAGVEASYNKATNRVEFLVWDTGIGVPENKIPAMFERFVQLDSGLSRQHEGTGLGLSLVWKLVEQHRGTIDVQSVPGEGTRITVAIPAVPSPAAPGPAAASETIPAGISAENSAPDLSGCTLLLAEDNEANIATFQSYLVRCGAQVCVAGDGLQAVELAREVRPDLILMDIQMPKLDGLEAIRQIRAIPGFHALPIIALTGLAMCQDRESCLTAGASDYLSKPVNLHDLVEQIRALLSEEG